MRHPRARSAPLFPGLLCLLIVLASINTHANGMSDFSEDGAAFTPFASASPATRGTDPTNPDDSTLDPDGDGLTNREEFLNGTDPNRADTDADGLPDGYEVRYALDPLDATGENGTHGNPDGDGWTNIQEWTYVSPDGLLQGTNPREPNTDGDEYPDDATDPFPLDPFNGKSSNAVFFRVNTTGANRYFRCIAYDHYQGRGEQDWWAVNNWNLTLHNGSIIDPDPPLPWYNSTTRYDIDFLTENGSLFTTASLRFAPNGTVFLPHALNTANLTNTVPAREVLYDTELGLFMYNRSPGPSEPDHLSNFTLAIRDYYYPIYLLWQADSVKIPRYLGYPDYLVSDPNSSYYKILELARNITSTPGLEGAADYQKAKALADYLYNNYAFTANPIRVPSGEDPVYWFLYGQLATGNFNPNTTGYETPRFGEGNSLHFASAFVLLCRLVNISARFVEGYYSQESNPIPGQNGWTIRGKNLKAWGECIFDGFGWVEFDPTPQPPQPDEDEGPDKTRDDDKDGILDYLEAGDGNPNTVSNDHDNDGLPDAMDEDDDNDGINDSVDQQPRDHDNDGVADDEDTDSDNDGFPDQQWLPMDLDSDGLLNPYDPDRDGNGINDSSDPDQGGTVDWGNASVAARHWRNATNDLDNDGIANDEDPDDDGDGEPDCTDEDDDNDGVNDPDDVDDDNDGVLDPLDTDTNNDLDDDGLANELDPDIDGDWVANELDLDDDNDGLPDFWDPDRDNDGINDSEEQSYGGTPQPDTDNDLDDDGVANELDPDLDDGSGVNRDDDRDGVPNTDDVDDDNDGILDPWDTDTGISGDDDWDNDGLVNGLDDDIDNNELTNNEDPDDDNDGVWDVFDDDYDNNGLPDTPALVTDQDLCVFDHDNDNLPDHFDNDKDGDGRIDTDGDGLEDIGTGDHDHDDDGLRDDVDADDDEDGVTDTDEIVLYSRLFDLPPINPWDHDNDGDPDDIDPDDDNDGRTDTDSDADHFEDGYNTSDWDADNDGVLDKSDKLPTEVNLTVPTIGYLAEPLAITGQIRLTNGSVAPRLVVSVHINRTVYNGTSPEVLDISYSVYESATVQADDAGNFRLSLYPRLPDVTVGPNTSYGVVAEVHELLFFKGSWSVLHPLELRSRTIVAIEAPSSLISDEEPLRIISTVKYYGTQTAVSFANLTVTFINHTYPEYPTSKDGQMDIYYDSANGTLRATPAVNQTHFPNVSMPVGLYELNVSFIPPYTGTPESGNESENASDPASLLRYLEPSAAVESIIVRHRANFTAFLQTPNGTITPFSNATNLTVTVGEALSFFGRVHEVGAGRYADLVLSMNDEQLQTIETNATGYYSSTVTFRADTFAAGYKILTLAFVAAGYYLPSETMEQDLTLIGTSAFKQLSALDVYRGQPAKISGRLVSNLNTGLKAAAVSIQWGTTYQFFAQTDAHGWFQGTYDVPGAFPLGAVNISLNYTGSAIYHGTTATTHYHMISGTEFFVQGYTNITMRGTTEHAFRVWGVLTDDNSTPASDPGRPLAGMTVELVEARTVLMEQNTMANGMFNFSYLIPATDEVGNRTFHLRFNGSGPYLPTISGDLEFTVIAMTNLTVTPLAIKLDRMDDDFTPAPKTFKVTGRLVDDQREPIFLADIHISIPTLNIEADVQTDSSGRFSHQLKITDYQPLGRFNISVDYPGLTDHYLGTVWNGMMELYAGAMLNSTTLPYLVRNESTPFTIHLYQSNGPAITNAPVRIGLGDTLLAEGSTNEEGRFTASLTLSNESALGARLLWVAYDGAAYIEPLNHSMTIVVKARTAIELVEIPTALRTGDPFSVLARLVMDNGSAISGMNVVLESDWLEHGLENLTGEDGVVPFRLIYSASPSTSANQTYTLRFNGSLTFLPAVRAFEVGWRPEPVTQGQDLTLEFIIVGIIIAGAVGLYLFFFFRRKVEEKEQQLIIPKRRLRRYKKPRSKEVREIFALYRRYTQKLAEAGYLTPPTRTVWEEAAGAEGRGIALPRAHLERLLLAFERARYSDQWIDDHDVQRADEDYQTLLHAFERQTEGGQ